MSHYSYNGYINQAKNGEWGIQLINIINIYFHMTKRKYSDVFEKYSQHLTETMMNKPRDLYLLYMTLRIGWRHRPLNYRTVHSNWSKGRT